VTHLFLSLEALTHALLDKGNLIRGAVVKGRLYHDQLSVFSDALVRAYVAESTVARFPRIILLRVVVNDYRSVDHSSDEDKYDFIHQSEDGSFFLNSLEIISQVFGDLSDPDGRMNQIHRFHLMAAKIQEQFDASVDNPRVFEKVQWFARYWNETVWQFGGTVHRIRGPGVTPVPEEVRSTWEPENWR
jgi:hypothetical protein